MARKTAASRSTANLRRTSSGRIAPEKIRRFRRAVLEYYHRHGRGAQDLPWRAARDPYRILVSEFMLQQTQVDRVTPKYREFLREFPTLRCLAAAGLDRVLSVWRGLGYNRRARNILRCARAVMDNHDGRLPRDYEALIALPGVGQSTAGALLNFAFSIPTVFIETNIRAVYIHHFFPRARVVADRDLLPLLERTMDRRNPREWYYALMDYGVSLKRSLKDDPGRRSTIYKKQSPFKGSRREIRGGILKLLVEIPGGMTVFGISRSLGMDIDRVNGVLDGLWRDGFLEKKERRYRIIGRS